MKVMYSLALIAFLGLCINAHAQLSQTYNFTSNDVFLAPVPAMQSGIYPASDFSQITNPMVAEGLADNYNIYPMANLIYSAAGNATDVFFGGDSPNVPSAASGIRSTAVIINETYDISDFPIKLEGEFFNRSGDALYNESYFWIGPSDYTGFTGWYVSSSHKQGIMLGESPEKFVIAEGISSGPSQNLILQTNHNLANYNNWYTMEVVLDVLNGDLTINDVKINGQNLSNQSLAGTVPNISFLNDFRLAMQIDDLGRAFKITTNFGIDSANVGIRNIKTENNLAVKISPNPSTGSFNVTLNNTPNTKLKLSLCNQLGQKVYVLLNEKLIDSSTELQFTKLTEKLTAGLYYLIVEEDSQVVSSHPIILK